MIKRAVLFIIAANFLLVSLAAPGASAISSSEFQAGRIMDDGVFFNANTMNAEGIQAFLNSKVPNCDTNGTKAYGGTTRAAYGASKGHPAPYICLRNFVQETPSLGSESGLCNAYVGGSKTAAQIIYDVSQSCGINPKVLVVLLEKEQSLVTDEWPWEIQYKSATGYGCPDTAACDEQYYGFFNQVYSAARQFKNYALKPHLFSYRSGRNNSIQYNPNASCGAGTVFIQNQTTAGLYNYTPYQPNAAALNNLEGIGDSCSAYGNRNFWTLYYKWFGWPFGAVKLVDSPATISWGGNRIDTFGRGADGALWQKWYDPGTGQWQPWAKLGGTLSSSPAVTTWGIGRFDIFTTTSAGDLQHLWYGNGAWQTWESLGQPSSSVKLVSAPGAVSWADGRIDVFGRGSDGELWQKWYDVRAGGWQPWVHHSGVLNSAPTVASWAENRIDLFSIGPAGDLQHYWYDNGWKNWESLGKPASNVSLTFAPGAVSWGEGRIDILGRGSDGVLWHKWYDVKANGWHDWTRFTGVLNSAPSVSTWGPGRLDIASTGPAGDLQHYWYAGNAGGWSTYWESLGIPAP